MTLRYKIILIILTVLVFAVGLGTGYVFGVHHESGILAKELSLIHPLRDHISSYKLISPLLAYVVPSADQQGQLVSLKNAVSSYVSSQKSNGLSSASVYFYDLNRGRWMGINETEKYNPASMLKVVIMVSYFKEAEADPSILGDSLIYTNAIDAAVKSDAFNSLSNLQIGQSYTVEDLIEKMITNSDNGAEILLLSNISSNSLDSIYNDLNIDSPDKVTGAFTISPREYSLFFRIIYSATYLDQGMSEKAMELLSKTTFTSGLVAGVPNNTMVAHKFGEYVTNSDGQIQSVELHDCGIVYYPVNPYFLCVMTRGSSVNELQSVIKNISSLVYQNYSMYK